MKGRVIGLWIDRPEEHKRKAKKKKKVEGKDEYGGDDHGSEKDLHEKLAAKQKVPEGR